MKSKDQSLRSGIRYKVKMPYTKSVMQHPSKTASDHKVHHHAEEQVELKHPRAFLNSAASQTGNRGEIS